MDKLLNCPWCGGKAKLEKILFWHYVECNSWKCHMIPSTVLGKKEEVIEKWNTRAPIVQDQLCRLPTVSPKLPSLIAKELEQNGWRVDIEDIEMVLTAYKKLGNFG